MANVFADVLFLVVVGALWGCTNPFLKKGGAGIEKVSQPTAKSYLPGFVQELLFLMSSWRYVLPFMLNQCGSLVFYFTLSSADLSLAVPLANALAFLFTAFTGWLVGERTHVQSVRHVTGMVLIVAGVAMCTYAKA